MNIRPLYLDGRFGLRFRLDDVALRMEKPGAAWTHVPLRKIGHVTVRSPASQSLRALLALSAQGSAIQFQGAEGHVIARMHPENRPVQPWAEQLALEIRWRRSHSYYAHWRDTQLAHAYSRIYRSAPVGIYSRWRARLHSYAARPIGHPRWRSLWLELRGLLANWIDQWMFDQGALPLIQAARSQNLLLMHDLTECLSIPLIWRIAPNLRTDPQTNLLRSLIWVEDSAPLLQARAQLHLNALAHQLHTCREQLADDLETGE